jgi:hypothetical protein
VRLTTLGGTKVFAGCRSTGTGAASLLNAQGATLNDFALKSLLGSVSLFGSDHVHKAKSTRLLGVGVKHDRAVVNIAVLLKQTRDVGLGQTWVDASDKEVGTAVEGTFILLLDRLASQRSSAKRGLIRSRIDVID